MLLFGQILPCGEDCAADMYGVLNILGVRDNA